MKIKKALFSLFLFFLFVNNSISQKSESSDSSYYMTFSGKKTYFKGESLLWSDNEFTIISGLGKSQTTQRVKIDSVERLKFGNGLFLNIKGEYNRKNMVAIIAYSEKYMIGYEYSGQKSLYVYDIDGNVLEKRMLVNNAKYLKKALVKIKEYFGDCTDLMKKFEAVTKDYDYDTVLFDYISMYQCGDKPLFND